MKRWPSLRLVKPQSLSMARAKASKPHLVTSYFNELSAILKKYDLEGKGERIYNVDEVGFNCEHRPVKIVARKTLTRPQFIVTPRSSLTTLIACGNAAGECLPPFLVFKGKRNLDKFKDGAIPGTRVQMSDSGWSNSIIFEDFFKSHFTPFADARREKGEKVILIYDGHKSHVPINVIKHAREHNIVLFLLPAHTSHFLQPLDVGVFSPLKSHYNVTCSRYLREHPGKVITRDLLTKLIGESYLRTVNKSNLQAGFRATGIHPFHPDKINAEEMCCPASLVNPSNEHEVGLTRDTASDAEAAAFLINRRPTPPSEDSAITRKRKFQPAGVAITETDVYHKILQANGGDPDDDDDTFQVPEEIQPSKKCKKKDKNPMPASRKEFATPTAAPAQSEIPGTSGMNDSSQTRRKLVFREDAQSDDELEEDDESSNCCVCQASVPKQVDRTHVFILDWVKCDHCNHWVHLRYCCRWFRAPKSFDCPCCDES
nr:uncharacterized protein LOC129266029 [Lytechinus pictus]